MILDAVFRQGYKSPLRLIKNVVPVSIKQPIKDRFVAFNRSKPDTLKRCVIGVGLLNSDSSENQFFSELDQTLSSSGDITLIALEPDDTAQNLQRPSKFVGIPFAKESQPKDDSQSHSGCDALEHIQLPPWLYCLNEKANSDSDASLDYAAKFIDNFVRLSHPLAIVAHTNLNAIQALCVHAAQYYGIPIYEVAPTPSLMSTKAYLNTSRIETTLTSQHSTALYSVNSLTTDILRNVDTIKAQNQRMHHPIAHYRVEHRIKKIRRLPSPVISSTDDNRTLVILNISRLFYANKPHSGISRYTDEIATRLLATRSFNVILGVEDLDSLDQSNLRNGVKKFAVDDLESALFYAENTHKPYIYHSPFEPHYLDTNLRYGIKVITIHDILHLTMPRVYIRPPEITQQIASCASNADCNKVFVSHFSKSAFENHTGVCERLKSRVTYLGVSDAFQPLASAMANTHRRKDDPELLIIPYQADPRKGFKRMIESSFHWLSQFEGDAEILIFGPKSERNTAMKSVKNTIPRREIKAYTYIESPSDEELAQLYTCATAQLYLSEAEGFGLPPLEAMAMGCPSIMLNNTALNEVYNGWELMLNDELNVSSTITTILNDITTDHSYREKLRIGAIALSQRYSWERCFAETKDVYHSLLS
ncbi:D-inositol-3-phosphate glycosyltransferase [BD1-7 clade bacterium]|uniref:D-inositol-3-phosphate glycosyltransferase n=1 Tax=BD1-7 clade bacterium TaxID=2029982 RepID=A0A5S9QFH5_9GAMM|nr:D-inositol-3-phosphate glycosyltransferase [BD1-7 clade bacterium]CAA0117247.1 D-inositol-3-phosphate glycosyltransferase [BD1-7 clade bacterium]